jgi:hypothetical protein
MDSNKKDFKQTKISFSKAPAKKVIQKTHLVNEKTSTKEIGLIRKFIKWIY